MKGIILRQKAVFLRINYIEEKNEFRFFFFIRKNNG